MHARMHAHTWSDYNWSNGFPVINTVEYSNSVHYSCLFLTRICWNGHWSLEVVYFIIFKHPMLVLVQCVQI